MTPQTDFHCWFWSPWPAFDVVLKLVSQPVDTWRKTVTQGVTIFLKRLVSYRCHTTPSRPKALFTGIKSPSGLSQMYLIVLNKIKKS